MKISKLLILVSILSLFMVITTCGKKYIGYGVILWNRNSNALANGEVVRIRQKSNIRNTYLIERVGGEQMEVETGLVRLFEKKSDAESFSEIYSRYGKTFAFAINNGLPIREKPEANSRRIYKLKRGEVIKVISRGENKQKVGAYENYWYDVLTQDGHEGFCYGQNLRIFETDRNPAEMVKELMAEDPVLNSILEREWRPDYFKEMIEENRYDLNKFRLDIGLFPDRQEKVVRLVTDKYSLVFRYTSVEKIGENRYLFKGSDLRVTVYGKNRIAVFYSLNGKNVSSVYVSLGVDVGEVIKKEIDRRSEIYKALLETGKKMSSKFYGTITLMDDKSFAWYNPGKLKGRIIPADAGETGKIGFNYYLPDFLGSKYDGVLTFYFDGIPIDDGVTFLYKKVDNGIRLVYVDSDNIENLIVKGSSVPPVILYFSYSD